MNRDATRTFRVIRRPDSALPFLHNGLCELGDILVCIASLFADSDTDFGFLEAA